MARYPLDKKSVIITGASDGIGRALTERLVLRHDCMVLGVARSRDKLESVKAALGERAENFSFVCADVTDREFWTDLANSCISDGVTFDLLINNAGIMPPFAPVDKTAAEVFDRITAVNYRAVYDATKAMLPVLRRSKSGGIVNISSSAALCPLAGTAAYSASKAAVVAFTEALAAEEKGLLVSYACPGFTKTNLFNETDGFFEHKIISLLASTVSDMADKIIRGIKKGKKRMVFGKDAHSMRALHKIAPTLAAPTIRAVMKASGMDIFGDMWD